MLTDRSSVKLLNRLCSSGRVTVKSGVLCRFLVCYMPLHVEGALRLGVLGVLPPSLSLSACERAERGDLIM